MHRLVSTGTRTTLTLLVATSIGLAALFQPEPSFAQQQNLSASIVSGTCDAIGAEVAALNAATVPDRPTRGAANALPSANSFSTVAVGIDALLAEDHAINITGRDGEALTCGEIGGRVTEAGSLIVGLHQDSARDTGGVVVLSPDVSGLTNVSLFVTGEALAASRIDSQSTSRDSIDPLAAIGLDEQNGTEQSSEVSQLPETVGAGFSSAEEAYVFELYPITEEASGTLLGLGTLFDEPDFASAAWRQEVEGELDLLHLYYAQVLSISPPPAMAEIHAHALEAFRLMDSAATDISLGMDTLNPVLLEQAVGKLGQGSAELIEATRLMNELAAARGA